MALLIDICSDLYSSIFSYWYVWVYATGMFAFYCYRRYNDQQLLKTDKANLLRKNAAGFPPQKSGVSTERNFHAGALTQSAAEAYSETDAGFDFGAQPCVSAAHWQRLSDIVDAATTRNDMIDRLQSKTSDHLSAAEYRFNTLLQEIGDVMPLPIQPSKTGTRLHPIAKAQNIDLAEALAA